MKIPEAGKAAAGTAATTGTKATGAHQQHHGSRFLSRDQIKGMVKVRCE